MSWTKEMDNTLRSVAREGGSFSDVATKLHVTRSAVAGRAWRIGVKFRNVVPQPDWSFHELSYLEDNYPTMTAEQIGRKLGRTAYAVRKKVYLYGFQKRRAA